MANYVSFERKEGELKASGDSQDLEDDDLLKWLGTHPDVRVTEHDSRTTGRLLGRMEAAGFTFRRTPWGEVVLQAGDEHLVLRMDGQEIRGRLVTP